MGQASPDPKRPVLLDNESETEPVEQSAKRAPKSTPGKEQLPGVSMTLEKWGHCPKLWGNDPIVKGS